MLQYKLPIRKLSTVNITMFLVEESCLLALLQNKLIKIPLLEDQKKVKQV